MMDIRITPTKAKEILEMFDWEEKQINENKERYQGYISGTKDFLAILNLTKDDLKSLIKQNI